jgi:hypothetical protein
MLNECIEKIEEEISKLNGIVAANIANELIAWMCENVEKFIDNHEDKYSISFGNVDKTKYPSMYMVESTVMSILSKTESFDKSDYALAAEGERVEIEMFEGVSRVMSETTELLKNDRNISAPAFNRMKFYYEVCGFNRGVAVVKELDGYLSFSGVDFDSNSMDIIVTTISDGKRELSSEEQDESATSFNAGAAFVAEFKINHWEKKQETGLF